MEKGGTPQMPPVGDMPHLLGYWRHAGTATLGGMAAAALTAQDLLAWQHGTQTPLMPVEFQTILDMSREYVGFLHAAEDPDCPPPFGEEVQVDRADLKKRLGAALKAMATSRKPQ